MLYITKEGEVLKEDKELNHAQDLYDSWIDGKSVFTLQTSGSTGKPKDISVSRDAILNSILTTKKTFNLDSDTVFLCNLSTDYIGGKMMVLRAAEIKCDIMIIPPSANPFEEANPYIHYFSQNWGNNFFSFVPLQLKNLLEKEEYIQLLRTAKAILVGGSKVSKELGDLIKVHELNVFETYGMTETVSHIAIKNLRKGDSYFTALENVKIDVDENSCLKINAPSTLNKWIVTHDIVEIISKNSFILKGRKDNIINSGGIKIQLEEVERLVSEVYPNLGNFFCYGLKDEILGEKLVIITENLKLDLTELKLNAPKYHVPKEIIYIDKIDLTLSGKIDKIKIIAKLIEQKND